MKYTIIALLLLFGNHLFAQGGWIKKHNLDTVGVSGGMADTANGKLYIGGGSDGSYFTSRIWEYDPHYNSWKHKSGLPVTSGYSGERMGGFCVGVNNKLYFGLGLSYYSSYSGCEFYTIEYDPAADTFSRKADFPGPSRY
ncbi:MAG: hypothetical protein JSS96_17415, partial [Bacteroidetes bacterium]|nr:hypothetical protein [Bacteroidota bacterium]